MAVTNVIFADVSSLTVAGSLVDAANGFQASAGADVRPIYAFGSANPVVLVSSKTPGTGSFNYTVSNGLQSGVEAWNTIIAAAVITCAGSSVPTGSTETVSLSGCVFSGQQIGMNAKNEMTCSVSFTFASGSI